MLKNKFPQITYVLDTEKWSDVELMQILKEVDCEFDNGIHTVFIERGILRYGIQRSKNMFQMVEQVLAKPGRPGSKTYSDYRYIVEFNERYEKNVHSHPGSKEARERYIARKTYNKIYDIAKLMKEDVWYTRDKF